jgi:uncharacterized membrane protein
MRSFKYWLGVIALILTIKSFGYLWGSITAFVVLLLGVSFSIYWEKVKKLKRFGKRWENFYIVTRHPETGKEPDLGGLAKVEDLVVYAPYGKALRKAAYLKKWLQKAQNPLFLSGDLKIKILIYQDGVDVNESWEEYEDRASFEIRKDRAKRHGGIKEQNGAWYNKHGNKEGNTISWGEW